MTFPGGIKLMTVLKEDERSNVSPRQSSPGEPDTSMDLLFAMANDEVLDPIRVM
jgi:hypothetical protein